MSVKVTLSLRRRASRNDLNVLMRVTESTTMSATMTARRVAIDTRGFAGEKNSQREIQLTSVRTRQFLSMAVKRNNDIAHMNRVLGE
jgi:hypothetical protein